MNTIFNKISNSARRNPKGLYVLFYTEAQELFGRFGISSLLVLYLTKTLHLADATAFTVFSTFIALNYATPLLGGFFSDRYLGYRHAVILGGIIMACGNALLVIPNLITVYLGLAIVAVGSGLFTPTLAAMVGKLYKKDDGNRDTGFTIYYIGKNVGALLAPISCGIVAQYFNFNYAFILSTLGMLSGVAVFIFGSKHLTENSAAISRTQTRFLTFKMSTIIYGLQILLIPIAFFIIDKNIGKYLLIAAGVAVAFFIAKLMRKLNRVERNHMLFILIMALFVIIFYAYLSQGGTTLNLFIDRIINRHIFNITIPASVFYSLDPAFMIIAGPLLAMFFARLALRNYPVSAVSKFAIGMLLLSAGFAVFVLACAHAVSHTHASMLYVVAAYALFPIAELCIMPIGLSLVTKYAPRNLEAFMVGIFMLASAVASYFTGVISQSGKITFSMASAAGLQHAAFIYRHLFAETAVILVAAALLLLLLKPLLRQLSAIPKVTKKSNVKSETPVTKAMEL